MNKARRAEIAELIDLLRPLVDTIDDLKTRIENVRDEEQEYYDNMPEGLQMSDRGQTAEAAISELDDVVSMFDDFDVETIIGSLETAAE